MDVNEMVDRYVNEVGENLPRKLRADIEMELRSLLHDTIEEQTNGDASPKIAAAILQEFGHPKEIAAKYRPEEVLIGAQLFPIYKMVIKITISIVAVLHLLGMGAELWATGSVDFIGSIIDSALSFARSAVVNAGVVTVIFAIIERIPGATVEIPEQQPKSWDPFELPPVKDPDRINRGEMIVGIVFGLIFIGWLNVFPNWLGGVEFTGSDAGIYALVTPEFIRLIPWLTASWLMEVVLKTAVVVQGRWHRITRWIELFVEVFGLYVVYLIYSLDSITFVPFFDWVISGILIVVMVIAGLGIVSKLFRLLLGRPFIPQNIFKSKLA